jgi:hypothetical protein
MELFLSSVYGNQTTPTMLGLTSVNGPTFLYLSKGTNRVGVPVWRRVRIFPRNPCES